MALTDRLTRLRELDLHRIEITDAGLVHLQGLTGLERLHLTSTPITDAGLVHLQGLTCLRDCSGFDASGCPAS